MGSKLLEDRKPLHLIFFSSREISSVLAVPAKSQGRRKQEKFLLGSFSSLGAG